VEKRLVAVLSVSLVAALIVIAYQAGKLSAVRQNESIPPPAAVTASEKPEEAAPIPPPPVEPAAPPVDKPQEPLLPPPPSTPAETPRPYAPPPSPSALPPRVEHTEPPHPPPQTGSSAAIASYFAKVDAIHVEGSGDPNTFAQGIISGIQSGDSSQMDRLVNNAKFALSQATSLQPPPAAAEYHRRLIETLSESVAGLEKFRDAIAKSDLDSITSVAQQFQSTQKKVNDLESMRKQLLGQ
jgi:outer membrane biosynthesis protein TonB